MAKAPQRKTTAGKTAAKPAPKAGPKKKTARRSPIAIKGEKQVKATKASDPVKPVNVSKAARKPLPKRAIDRRTNVEPGGPVGDGPS